METNGNVENNFENENNLYKATNKILFENFRMIFFSMMN